MSSCQISTHGGACMAFCNSGARFYLSRLSVTPMYNATDANAHRYYFSVCSSLRPSDVQCAGSITTSPIAIQSWGYDPPQLPNLPSDSCAGLGSVDTMLCHSRGGSLLTCSFRGGDAGRSISISYRCSQKQQAPTVVQTGVDLHYDIEWIGPAGCASGFVPPPAPPPPPPSPPPCEKYANLRDDYPFCDPPGSSDPYAVDLSKVLGPNCLDRGRWDPRGCCFVPLGYGGGPRFGTSCKEACEKQSRLGLDDAYCERYGRSEPYGNCFCGGAK